MWGLWVPGPLGQNLKKIRFMNKLGVQDDGSRNVAKRSSDHHIQQRYATREPDKVKGQDPIGIAEGSYGYRARAFSIRGTFALSRNLGYKTIGVAMLLNKVLTTPSSSGIIRESQAKLRDGTMWGL